MNKRNKPSFARFVGLLAVVGITFLLVISFGSDLMHKGLSNGLVAQADAKRPPALKLPRAGSSSWVYTTSADWAKGVEQGVNHTAGYLQLNEQTAMHKFIWVANSAEHTVSKLDTDTGKELARYRTDLIFGTAGDVMQGVTGDPSRTAVDLNGNVWVANRASYSGSGKNGAILKIALDPAADGVDRNGNGVINTSTDKNGNGKIDADEILPTGQDEAVLLAIDLGPNTEPRAVAVDKDNNVWVGLTNPPPGQDSPVFYKMDNNSGKILATIDVKSSTYGAAIDKDGFLWSPDRFDSTITKIDTSTATVAAGFPIAGDEQLYGVAVDNDGNVWMGDSWYYRVLKLNAATSQISYVGVSGACPRGVAIDAQGFIWLADSCGNTAIKLDSSGREISRLPVGSGPVGIAVDRDNNVWTVNQSSSNVTKINANVDPPAVVGSYPVGQGPYTYSDMTGYALRHFVTQSGTWTVQEDSGTSGLKWGTVSWKSTEPAGTSVSVYFRSANTSTDLTAAEWGEVANGVAFAAQGQFFQLRAMLSTAPGSGASPTVTEIKVNALEIPKIAVNPLSIDFGGVTVDKQSQPFTLTISNSGTGALDLGGLSIDNTAEFSLATDACSHQSIAPGAAGCTATLIFSPVDPSGAKSAILSVSSNDPDTPLVEVPLYGNALEGQKVLTLTVTKQGAGLGTITSTPAGVDCQVGCTQDVKQFPKDTVVTLDAIPDSCSVFKEWGGACSGTGPCTFTLTNDTKVTATFDLAIRKIIATAIGSGAISPPGEVNVQCGSDQTFQIIPDQGLLVEDVLVDGQSVGALIAYTFNGVVVDRTIEASFSSRFAITGKVKDQKNSPLRGVAVRILGPRPGVATTDYTAGSYAIKGVPEGSYIVTPKKPGYTFSPAFKKVTVKGKDAIADFKATQVKTYSVSGHVYADAKPLPGVRMIIKLKGGNTSKEASTDSKGNYTFKNMKAGKYTVTPVKTGYKFKPVSQTVSVDGDKNGVNFEGTTVKFNLTVAKGGNGGDGTVVSQPTGIDCGTVCKADYDANTNVTLTATPRADSTFKGWKGNGCSGTAPCTVLMNRDKTVEAIFDISVPTIDASVEGPGTIDPSGKVQVTYGEDKTFNIVPDAGCRIKDVLVDGKSQGAKSTYTFRKVTKDHTIHAVFVGTTSYSISGKVTQSGKGLSQVTLTLSGDADKETTTDFKGMYSFKDLPNGNYTVTPKKTGYKFIPGSRDVTVDGQNKTADFTAQKK